MYDNNGYPNEISCGSISMEKQLEEMKQDLQRVEKLRDDLGDLLRTTPGHMFGRSEDRKTFFAVYGGAVIEAERKRDGFEKFLEKVESQK